MGIFNAVALFLKQFSKFVKFNYLLLHIRTTFLGFTPCDGWLREFSLCVTHIYNPVDKEVKSSQVK